LALADLDAQLILTFLDHLEKDRKNGARSRNARLAALRSFLKYATHYDLTALPVIEQALAIPMKRFDRPVLGFLSRQEMQAILEAPDPRTWAGQRDRALFSLMYNTGARVSEVIGLHVGDVVIDGATAAHLHGKGRKERGVPFWRLTALLIRGWKRRLEEAGDDSFLFPSRGGERMARSNVTQRLDLAVSAAAERHPQLERRSISPHTISRSPAAPIALAITKSAKRSIMSTAIRSKRPSIRSRRGSIRTPRASISTSSAPSRAASGGG